MTSRQSKHASQSVGMSPTATELWPVGSEFPSGKFCPLEESTWTQEKMVAFPSTASRRNLKEDVKKLGTKSLTFILQDLQCSSKKKKNSTYALQEK